MLTPRLVLGGVLCTGFAWSALLYALAPTDVFYTGDAGLKSLLIEQLARGELRPQLELAAPPWVHALWEQGFQPFGPPFVYAENTVSFPIYFSLVCAPFYALAGLRGALLVPLLALWGVWLQVWRLCRLRALSDWQTTAALAIVILASPLTLYGAILWEHTLGVLLFTFALEALFREQVSFARATLLGCLAGLSVSVRSELYVPLALIALVLHFPKRALPFGLGLGAGVLLVWGTNLALYGRPLGLHGAQVLEDGSPFISRVLARAASMDAKLLLTVPASALALYAGVRGGTRTVRPLLVLVLSLLLIPLIVPNDGIRQIGPRYYLCLVPLIALLAVEDLRARWQPLAWVAVVLLGVRFDVLRSSHELVRDYQSGRDPALAALRLAPQSVIVVERQETAHELASLFADKHVLRADDAHQLGELSDRLNEHGHASFLLVRFQRDPSKIGDALTTPAGRSLELVESRTVGAFALRAMQTSPR